MLNTIWALIIPQALPLWNVILMMNFFRRVPKELEEASIIDGATYWQILLHVYLPISVPALATLTLFGAVGHWNAWFDGMILIADRDLDSFADVFAHGGGEDGYERVHAQS